MSSTYGDKIKISVFGESHGNGIGVVIDGLPAGFEVDFDRVLAQMARRAPGKDKTATPRKEKDLPTVLSGTGTSGALVKMAGGPSGGNSVLIYFACEDCAVEAERVTKFGGRVERPKFSIGEYGYIALVRDTEGNMIGLHSMTQSVDRP